MQLHDLAPRRCAEPGLFPQLPFRGVERLFVQRRAAHRQLPGPGAKRVTLLADQPDVVVSIERNDCDRNVLEVHPAVLIFSTARIDDVILTHLHPVILVYRA